MAGLVGLAALLHVVHAGPTLTFICCALALAGVAHVIGEATDQLGNHLGPAATGIVQSAVGNLPELFVCIFALRAGLITVVQTSLVGSILSNALLVLGLAFVAGGLRHGVLIFESQTPRMIAILLLLAVAALVLPTLAHELHLPAGAHEQPLSVICAVVLLMVFSVLTGRCWCRVSGPCPPRRTPELSLVAGDRRWRSYGLWSRRGSGVRLVCRGTGARHQRTRN